MVTPATLTIIIHLAVAASSTATLDACIRAAATIGTQAILIGQVECVAMVDGVEVERIELPRRAAD
jgi:hypothetical protein